MSVLIIELPDNVLNAIHEEADQRGTSVQRVAEEWLIERTIVRPSLTAEREPLRQLLRGNGLLSENVSPEQIDEPELSPEEIRNAMKRAGGKSLSEIVIEQRCPNRKRKRA